MNLASIIVIEEQWLSFLLGVLLPAGVALVTKSHASAAVKAWVLVGLTTLSTVLTQFASGFSLQEFVVAFFITYVTAISVHYGLLKPSHVTGSEGVIAEKIPGGLGTDTYKAKHLKD